MEDPPLGVSTGRRQPVRLTAGRPDHGLNPVRSQHNLIGVALTPALEDSSDIRHWLMTRGTDLAAPKAGVGSAWQDAILVCARVSGLREAWSLRNETGHCRKGLSSRHDARRLPPPICQPRAKSRTKDFASAVAVIAPRA